MASKLQIAVKARIPIVTCTTRDVVNLLAVLQHLLPNETIVPFGGPSNVHKAGAILYSVEMGFSNDVGLGTFRKKLTDNKNTLIIVNPPPAHNDDTSLSLGALPIPKALVKEMIAPICETEEILSGAMAALGGATIKEAYEIARYSMAEYKALSPAKLAASRNELFKPQKGLYPVSTEQEFYVPSKQIADWVENERHFFLNETDKRLIPRGLLLDGRPGTGKSEAAKFIARKFEVPLYRLDLATTQDKWLGNSAKFLQANLDMLDQQEPCVVLIDEIEKIFHENTHSSASDLLSMLLWWMQTHRSRVLTVATTNDISKLPKELYRPGRIDEVLVIQGLTPEQVGPFIQRALKLYGQADNEIMLNSIQDALLDEAKGNMVSQALVEARVIKALKQLKKAQVAPKKKLVIKTKTL